MVLHIHFHPPGPISCTGYQPHLPSKKNTSQGGPGHHSSTSHTQLFWGLSQTSPNMSSSFFYSSSSKDFTQPSSLACKNPSHVLWPSENIWTGPCLFFAIYRYSPSPALFFETWPASPLSDDNYPPSHGATLVPVTCTTVSLQLSLLPPFDILMYCLFTGWLITRTETPGRRHATGASVPRTRKATCHRNSINILLNEWISL